MVGSGVRSVSRHRHLYVFDEWRDIGRNNVENHWSAFSELGTNNKNPHAVMNMNEFPRPCFAMQE